MHLHVIFLSVFFLAYRKSTHINMTFFDNERLLAFPRLKYTVYNMLSWQNDCKTALSAILQAQTPGVTVTTFSLQARNANIAVMNHHRPQTGEQLDLLL